MKAQTDIVIRHMETRGGITTMTAFKRYGITRLSGRIFEAKRKRRKKIIAVMLRRGGKRFASYRLAV